MMRHFLLALPLLVVSTGAYAQEHRTFESPDAIKWQPAPPSLPRGAELAVLAGDPSASSGFFALRLKVPAGYQVLPHNHPTTEQVTVISGDFSIGMGDRFDESKGQHLKPGGFANMPAKMNHFAWSKNGAVFQLQGQSPFEITYVDPADDPRKQ
jgi:Domain of unknown function (DUF4437)